MPDNNQNGHQDTKRDITLTKYFHKVEIAGRRQIESVFLTGRHPLWYPPKEGFFQHLALDRHQPHRIGAPQSFRTIHDIEFGENGLEVAFDSVLTDTEDASDIMIRQTAPKMPDDLQFTRTKLC